MSKIEQFVAFARELIGTPFHHQGRVPGLGLDCIGTVAIAATKAGYSIADRSNYPHKPDGSFQESVEQHCDLIEFKDLRVGDLVMFKFDQEVHAQHIGIISNLEPLLMIHAYAQRKKVTENSIDATWLPILSGCYRFKDVE